MSDYPPEVVAFVAALNLFFAEEVPCSCAIAALSGIDCDFHWFLGQFNQLPEDLKALAAGASAAAGAEQG